MVRVYRPPHLLDGFEGDCTPVNPKAAIANRVSAYSLAPFHSSEDVSGSSTPGPRYKMLPCPS